MLVISKTKSSYGQYPPIQKSSSAGIPAGFYWWPDNLEQNTFNQYEGFVILDVARNTVKSYKPNEDAYNDWKDTPIETEPTDTEILNVLLGVDVNE